jgi:hypothetical protein
MGRSSWWVEVHTRLEKWIQMQHQTVCAQSWAFLHCAGVVGFALVLVVRHGEGVGS